MTYGDVYCRIKDRVYECDRDCSMVELLEHYSLIEGLFGRVGQKLELKLLTCKLRAEK